MTRLTSPLSLVLAAAGLAGFASAPAQAQDRGWNDGRPVITCSSDNNRRNQCGTPFRGRAVLVENISGTRCVEGNNWGSGNGFVWVDRGCRARFVEARGGGWGPGGNGDGRTVRCESNDRRQRVCDTGWRSAILTRQLSGTQCIEGRTWGSRNGSVWVNDGCRGEFAEGRGGGWGNGPGPGNNNYTVTCNSDNQRQRTCDWDRRQGRPYIVKQLSNTRCEEGRTWGYRNGQIWVDDGCRARFGAR